MQTGLYLLSFLTHSDRLSLETDQHQISFKLDVKSPFYNVDNASPKDLQDMLSELDVMKSLQPHPHVVKLIGCCIEKGNGHFLIFFSICISFKAFPFCLFNLILRIQMMKTEIQPLLFLMAFFFIRWGCV